MQNAHSTLAIMLFNMIPGQKVDTMSSLGLPSHIIDKLSNYSLSELYSIASRAEQYLTMSVDIPKLEIILNDELRHRVENDTQDELICNYATSSLMRELFGMHPREFTDRRTTLGMAGLGQHRPNYCDIETSLTIYDIWLKYSDLELPQRYLKVAEETCLPITTIRQAVLKNEENR